MGEMLKGNGSKVYAGLDRPLKVTVRFINRIVPSDPMLRLFGVGNKAPEHQLLDFPPCDGTKLEAGAIFGAGDEDIAATAVWAHQTARPEMLGKSSEITS